MATNIQAGTSHYGEIGQNLKDPIFIHQPDDHSCALRSQQIVLRDFGIDIPFKDLEKVALDNGVYSEDGTSMYDVGKVLDIAGVGMHQVESSNMLELTNELAQGHRVIVGVDADELWYNDSLKDKFSNWFHDVTGQQGGNHALIVAGVEVNPNNPQDVKVVLTDPGSGDLRIEYPMNQFMDAWKDSSCFMAATDNPAPFQYDPATKMEVPSNFVMEQHFNQFVAENSYQLSPDLINIPDGYQPVYSEHLDFVGDDEYDDFKEKYNDYRLLASSMEYEPTDHTEDSNPGFIDEDGHHNLEDYDADYEHHNLEDDEIEDGHHNLEDDEIDDGHHNQEDHEDDYEHHNQDDSDNYESDDAFDDYDDEDIE